MAERIQVQTTQEVDPIIHNFSNKELGEKLKAYDIVRNFWASVTLIGIGLIGSVTKLHVASFPMTTAYADGVIITGFGYWAMELYRESGKEAVAEARSRGLKVVKNLFARKLDLQVNQTAEINS